MTKAQRLLFVCAALLLLPAVVLAGKPTPTPTPPPVSNRAVAFQANVSNGSGHLYVMNADGSQRTDITPSSGKGTYHQLPAWSPDGTRIAHLRRTLNSRTNTIETQDLYTVNANGTGLSLLCHLDQQVGWKDRDARDSTRNRFDWSPDMRWIVFGGKAATTVGDSSEIWAVNVSPNGQGAPTCEFVQLTHANDPPVNCYAATNAAWSPVLLDDGTYLHTQIAYTLQCDYGLDYDLVFLDVRIEKSTGVLTTGQETRMVRPGTWERCPDWDSLGARVAFDRLTGGGIWSVAPGSTEQLIDPFLNVGPRWSSDNRMLVAGDSSNLMWRVCADGTRLTSLGAGGWPDWNPKWQNDLPAGTCP